MAIIVAEYIAEYLYQCGIRDVFMLSGAGSIHLDNAIQKHPSLREICIKNEATGPMMAKAYAQMRNNFGVVYVTTGPGGANAVTGVVECFVDSTPVLILSGQVPKAQTTHLQHVKGLRSFGVQELNIIDVVTPITKYAKMVTEPERILYELQKAIHIAKSGRPGPVWLDIPLDIQSATINPKQLDTFDGSIQQFPLNTTRLDADDKLIKDIEKSERPLIVAGQGIRNANAVYDLTLLAQRLDAPIILSRMGLDILPFSYKYNMGIGGFKGSRYNKRIMKEADLVISVGTSLSVAFAGYNASFFDKDAKIYMVDIETAEPYKFHSRLHGYFITDAHEFLTKLNKRLLDEHVFKTNTPWFELCLQRKNTENAQVLAREGNPIDIYYLVKKIDNVSNERDVFVDDAGSIYYVASQTLRFEWGQREITSGAYASMGNAIPLAIGVAVADPDVRVLAMTGDGSLETNVQELKTLSYYKLNVKLFVINNGGYISMRDHGRHAVGEQASILNLRKVADAFDMPYRKIENYKELDRLDDILNVPGPLFIEVMCDDKQKLILPT